MVDAGRQPLDHAEVLLAADERQHTGAGYDLPGIAWSTIFATGGVAVHSTFWHNNYGDAMSHGCVNVTPEDAKWLFRWTLPNVPYDPGMIDTTVTKEASTSVQVIES